LIDEPKTGEEIDQPTPEESRAADSGLVPESSGQSQTQSTSNSRQYRQKIMRSLEAIGNGYRRTTKGAWKLTKNSLQFFDAHDGAITALATVAIVALTIFYVSYSKKQWEEMRSARRPWLGMGERLTLRQDPSFSVEEASISSLEGETKFITIRFNVAGTLSNFGTSPARKVYVSLDTRTEDRFTDDFHKDSLLRNANCTVAESISEEKAIPYGNGGGILLSRPTKAVFPSVTIPIEEQIYTGTFAGANHRLSGIWIIGCIAYQDSFGGVYHTKVLYSPVMKRNKETAIFNPLLEWTPITEFVMEDSDSD
jgi:hypothetical protein